MPGLSRHPTSVDSSPSSACRKSATSRMEDRLSRRARSPNGANAPPATARHINTDKVATSRANASRSENPTDQVVTKLSPWSVAHAVARPSDLVAAKGMKLFAVIDHSGEAKASGSDLRDTKVLIFGSPQAGTPMMQAVPLAALDLPLKVLVWADGNQSKLSYTAPAALAARYEPSDALAARLSGIDALTNTLLDQ